MDQKGTPCGFRVDYGTDVHRSTPIAVDHAHRVGSGPVQQLFPTPVGDVDPLDCYLGEERPVRPGRPWVMLNMITTVDGASAADGVSGDLGGPADKAVFAAVRACCDWVLVASATANAERYRRPDAGERARAERHRRGMTATPRLAIVTARGTVDPDLPALTDPDDGRPAPLVVTGADGDLAALAGADVEIVRTSSPAPDPESVVAELGHRGAHVVLAEGGPRFNGLLYGSGLLDEVCLTVAPRVAGGHSSRIVDGAAPALSGLVLTRVLEQDGFLFLRYVRADHPTSAPGTTST